MSKFCPIHNCNTKCTDNCSECMAEEKRYLVKAYLCTNFAGFMDKLETDYFGEVEEFIWENCQKGYNCELIDRQTGETNVAYADSFNEESIDYSDLLMEQLEQL